MYPKICLKKHSADAPCQFDKDIQPPAERAGRRYLMKDFEELCFNLLGLLKNPDKLPEDVKKNKAIWHFRNKKDKKMASVRFDPDGDFFKSPVAGITEDSVDFFQIEVIDTCRNSRILARVGNNDRPRYPFTDKNSGKQQIRLTGKDATTLIRVNKEGHVEILRVSSEVINNRKQIEVFPLFKGKLLFENEAELKVVISDNEFLSLFEKDIKELHDSLNKPKERLPKTPPEKKKDETELEPKKEKPRTTNSFKNLGRMVNQTTNADKKKEGLSYCYGDS